jgi:hypothetical protein
LNPGRPASSPFCVLTDLPRLTFVMNWLLNITIKGKRKVVPVFFLTEHHAMKVYWGVEV